MMPLYEYSCDNCGNTFEKFERTEGDATCPECGSEAVTREVGSFSVCTSCARGGCPGGTCTM
jgi:putative FmdB family regulatory protein